MQTIDELREHARETMSDMMHDVDRHDEQVERFREAFKDWSAEDLHILGIDILGCLHYDRGAEGIVLTVGLIRFSVQEWNLDGHQN